MKVAVISKNNSSVGKSSFIIMLASLFSRTQRKTVALFSTDDASESFMEMAMVDDRATVTKTVSVYKALLESEIIHSEEVLDYGMRVGNENVWLYNIFSAAMKKHEIEELFLKTIGRIKVDLVLVEVKGDLNSEFNCKVLNECDAILCLFESSRQSLNFVKDYVENFDRKIVARTGYVCQKFEADAISGKRLLNYAGLHERSTMFIPYSPFVVEHTWKGDLNIVAKKICDCEPKVLPLRMKLVEVMQYLFDTNTYKYIKDYTNWYK